MHSSTFRSAPVKLFTVVNLHLHWNHWVVVLLLPVDFFFDASFVKEADNRGCLLETAPKQHFSARLSYISDPSIELLWKLCSSFYHFLCRTYARFVTALNWIFQLAVSVNKELANSIHLFSQLQFLFVQDRFLWKQWVFLAFKASLSHCHLAKSASSFSFLFPLFLLQISGCRSNVQI